MSIILCNLTATMLKNRLLYNQNIASQKEILTEPYNIYDDEKYINIINKLNVSLSNYITLFSRYAYFTKDVVDIIDEINYCLCCKQETFILKSITKYSIGKTYNIDDEFLLCDCKNDYMEEEKENLYNSFVNKNTYYFDNMCANQRPMHFLTSGLLCIGKNISENIYDYVVINSDLYIYNVIQINYNNRTFKFLTHNFEKYVMLQLENHYNSYLPNIEEK